jgi:hypothetical protein
MCFALNAKQPSCADLAKMNGRIRMEDNSTVQLADLFSNQEIPARKSNNSWKIFKSLARLMNVN